ncbi:MAG: Alkyl hydroperoxide reductase subunit C-like protein [Ignavibacteriae bacterium]|nr:MAG: Alkyl hydroperoxide reductase subunit C-like protein [Ignavibacteriota bacterium]
MRIMFLIIFSAFFVTNQVYLQELKVGDAAPNFKLPYATKDTIDQNGIQLSDLIGKKIIVIAFYPADWSPGCTNQMCSFRDDFEFFNDINAEVLAISGDYVWSHHNWAKSQNYQFKLLSDHNHKVAELYNSYNSDRGFNKRTVFIIDKNGKIAYIDWKYSTTDDSSLKKLKSKLNDITK